MSPSWDMSDVPIDSIADDHLWRGKTDVVRTEIERIAGRAVEPIVGDCAPMPSIVYAVHGGWGTGKSSFLKMVESEAIRLEKQEGVRGKLLVASCDASAYEAADADPRVALIKHVLCMLAGGDAEKAAKKFGRLFDLSIAEMEAHQPAAAKSKPASDPRGPGGAPCADADQVDSLDAKMLGLMHLELVASKAAIRADYPTLLDQEICANGRGDYGTPKAALFLIDELDRCQPKFVYNILRTVRHWHSFAHNLTFVLAVDPEALRRSIRASASSEAGYASDGTDGADYALQKYVQHGIDLPKVDQGRQQALIAAWLGSASNPTNAKNQTLEALKRHSIFLEFALLGDQYNNPRALKRTLSDLYPALEVRLKALPQSSDRVRQEELLVKECVLQYCWPGFYEHVFKPAVKDGSFSAYQHFERFETACAKYASPGKEVWEDVQIEVDRLRQRLGLTDLDLPRALASYLSLLPLWSGPAGGDKGGGAAGSPKEGGPAGPRPDEGAASSPKRPENVTPDPGLALPDVVVRRGEIRAHAFLLYTESEAAEQQNRVEEAKAKVLEYLQYVEQNRGAFDSEQGSVVGNVAMTAEKFGATDVALRLYSLALELNPDHSNNMQAFVSFILDAQLSQYYPLAAQMLGQLQTERHRGHRPDRTLSLRAQYAQLVKAVGPELPEQEWFDHLADTAQDYRPIGQAIALLGRAGRYDDAVKLGQRVFARQWPDEALFALRRYLADTLAKSPAPLDECKAMDLYRSLVPAELRTAPNPQAALEHFRSTLTADDLERIADTCSNYAVLLNSHDYDVESLRMAFCAYSLKPDDNTIRQIYAQRLLYFDMAGQAPDVMRGQPVTYPDQLRAKAISRPLPNGTFVEDYRPRNT